jgi:hypothetical protein
MTIHYCNKFEHTHTRRHTHIYRITRYYVEETWPLLLACGVLYFSIYNNIECYGITCFIFTAEACGHVTMKFSKKQVPDEWLGHFDMLRDFCRNRGYAAGVKLMARRQGFDGNSLWVDLGCGSCLLGCLAAKYLKIQVVAIECVPELAKIARETIRRNGLENLVTVWLAHSSDIDAEFMVRTFGKRAKYLTSELLDSTFLGEGLYEGLNHAKSNLLQPKALIPIHSIPHSGRVFIQVSVLITKHRGVFITLILDTGVVW